MGRAGSSTRELQQPVQEPGESRPAGDPLQRCESAQVSSRTDLTHDPLSVVVLKEVIANQGESTLVKEATGRLDDPPFGFADRGRLRPAGPAQIVDPASVRRDPKDCKEDLAFEDNDTLVTGTYIGQKPYELEWLGIGGKYALDQRLEPMAGLEVFTTAVERPRVIRRPDAPDALAAVTPVLLGDDGPGLPDEAGSIRDVARHDAGGKELVQPGSIEGTRVTVQDAGRTRDKAYLLLLPDESGQVGRRKRLVGAAVDEVKIGIAGRRCRVRWEGFELLKRERCGDP